MEKTNEGFSERIAFKLKVPWRERMRHMVVWVGVSRPRYAPRQTQWYVEKSRSRKKQQGMGSEWWAGVLHSVDLSFPIHTQKVWAWRLGQGEKLLDLHGDIQRNTSLLFVFQNGCPINGSEGGWCWKTPYTPWWWTNLFIKLLLHGGPSTGKTNRVRQGWASYLEVGDRNLSTETLIQNLF